MDSKRQHFLSIRNPTAYHEEDPLLQMPFLDIEATDIDALFDENALQQCTTVVDPCPGSSHNGSERYFRRLQTQQQTFVNASAMPPFVYNSNGKQPAATAVAATPSTAAPYFSTSFGTTNKHGIPHVCVISSSESSLSSTSSLSSSTPNDDINNVNAGPKTCWSSHQQHNTTYTKPKSSNYQPSFGWASGFPANQNVTVNKINQEEILTGVRSALHHACCDPAVTLREIDHRLERSPSQASYRVRVVTKQTWYSFKLGGKLVTQPRAERYTYPLHLSIQAGACREVIERLIDAAPAVLYKGDGNMNETPLHVLLKSNYCQKTRNNKKNTVEDLTFLVHKILSLAPETASMTDRHDNTVLHTAVAYCAGQKCYGRLIKRIIESHPPNLMKGNFHGKTPSEILQQRGVACRDEFAGLLLHVPAPRRRYHRV